MPMENSIKIEVNIKRIDQIILEQSLTGPILVKMDTEGHEPEALLGALGAIKHIRWISVDTGPERSGKKTTNQVWKILAEYGFDKIQVSESNIMTAYRSLDNSN